MLQHLPLIGVAIQLFHRPGEFSKESRVIQITVAFLQQEAGTGGGTKY